LHLKSGLKITEYSCFKPKKDQYMIPKIKRWINTKNTCFSSKITMFKEIIPIQAFGGFWKKSKIPLYVFGKPLKIILTGRHKKTGKKGEKTDIFESHT